MTPKISVIIPTKNRKASLLRCLDSVFSQTLKPFEVIVVDDGSSVDTSQFVLKQFPGTKFIKNEKSYGGAVARNQGATAAEGEYIAFIDSDDEWLPCHLSEKLTVLKTNNADGVFGTFYLLKGKQEEEIFFNVKKFQDLNIGNAILNIKRFDARTSTFVFRKEAFNQIKFDENLKKHQDWDLAINFDRKYKFVLDNKPSVKIYVEQGKTE